MLRFPAAAHQFFCPLLFLREELVWIVSTAPQRPLSSPVLSTERGGVLVQWLGARWIMDGSWGQARAAVRVKEGAPAVWRCKACPGESGSGQGIFHGTAPTRTLYFPRANRGGCPTGRSWGRRRPDISLRLDREKGLRATLGFLNSTSNETFTSPANMLPTQVGTRILQLHSIGIIVLSVACAYLRMRSSNMHPTTPHPSLG